MFSASEAVAEFGFLSAPSVVLSPGDLIVGARGSIGLTRRVTEPCTCTQTTIWVRPNTGAVNSAYLFWTLIAGRSAIFPFDKTAIPMLTVEQVRAAPLCLPPPSEQADIAAFLDRETAKIDALVEEQRRLVELLKEKRQAVISHAVTKGLDPTVPMKDSGVEWLGDVPAHWEVLSLRHSLLRVFNGTTATQVDSSDDTVLVSRIETISTGQVDDQKTGSIARRDAIENFRLKAGDLLFSNINSLKMIGNCALFDGSFELFAGMNLLHLRPNDTASPAWLYWLLRSPLTRQKVESLAKPAINQASLSQAHLLSIQSPRPPMEEQAQISEFLASETRRIYELSSEAETAITLLQERRSALISAAVTGKIDVRGLVPSEAEAA